MKILVLSCSTGEGHNSAARALCAQAAEMGIDADLADPVSFAGPRAARAVAGLYNRMIRHVPPLFGAVQMEIMNPGSMGVWFGTTRLTNAIVAAVMAIVAGVTYDRLGPVWTFSIFIACDAFIRMPLLASIPETLGRAMTDEEAHADPR